MSLINDYLKKTIKKTTANAQQEDVPPVLRNGHRNNSSNAIFRLMGLSALGAIPVVGAYLFLFPSSMPKTFPASEVTFPMEKTVQQSLDLTKGLEVETSMMSKTRKNSLPEGAAFQSKGASRDNAPNTSHENVSEKQSLTAELKLAKKIASWQGKASEPLQNEQLMQDSRAAPAAGIVKKSVPALPVRLESLTKDEKSQMPEVDISNYFQIALLAQKDGHYKEAERFYLEVLRREPFHLDTLTNLAVIYIKQENFSEAEKTIAEILRRDPDNAKAYVNLGIVNLHLNNTAGAKKQFNNALAINSQEVNALINLAYLAQKEDNKALMEKYYKEILSILPDSKDILLGYASLLENNSRFDEALSYYKRTLKLAELKEDPWLADQIKERMKIITYYKNNQTGE